MIKNTHILDIMNSNQRFDISLDGMVPSDTTSSTAFVVTPVVQSQTTERGKTQLLFAIFDTHSVNVLFT